ncbi:hypothetical protein [Enterobacter genomosp. S]|uniref:hypothetical protein n=1 Tax=Enterobacter genomosp. S TaxID=2364151 RepID=UPI001FD7F7C1|nr:hypothetical protein [Enterobacter genomosp. S]
MSVGKKSGENDGTHSTSFIKKPCNTAMITMHPSAKATKRFFTNRQIASIEFKKSKKRKKENQRSLKERNKRYFAQEQFQMK